MEFVTIASTGNAVDFGDQIDNRGGAGGSIINSWCMGRWLVAPGGRNKSGYIEILSTGNAVEILVI